MSLQPLADCDAAVADKFFHAVIDGICERRQPGVGDFGQGWTVQQWRTLVNDTTAMFQQCARTNTRDVSAVPAPNDAIAKQALEARENDLRKALVRQSCSIASSQMINFDWSIKMVLASDTLASQRVPLFHLEMEIAESDGSTHTIPVEMSLPELTDYVAKLNDANQAVRELRS